MITVHRWLNENTGRPTRKWYWQVDFGGTVIGAGIERSEADARAVSEERLALAAYTAGATSCVRGVA